MMDRLVSLGNQAYYFWRRNNWLVDPRAYLAHFRDVVVDRPIFLVGNQGDGLTLAARMLRRHPDVVSVSGDCRYWSGADEMHRTMVLKLPPSLTAAGRWGGAPKHEIMTPPHSWSYATDDLIGAYRKTEADFNERTARRLRSVLVESLYRHGTGGAGKRFVDKSQTYTVKMRFVAALLDGTHPHFLLITRNPYATCYRAAIGEAWDMRDYADRLDLDARFELCVQHWCNAMRIVLEDAEHVGHFKVMMFERFLVEPRDCVHEMCDYVGLEFQETMLPAEGQKVPFGTRFGRRWYPMRPNVNERYLNEIPDHYLDIVEERCGEMAAGFGYERP
ncbi:MAG: sulfotransferase [Planctomycetota bacterium]|jgi:hypothetical protein